MQSPLRARTYAFGLLTLLGLVTSCGKVDKTPPVYSCNLAATVQAPANSSDYILTDCYEFTDPGYKAGVNYGVTKKKGKTNFTSSELDDAKASCVGLSGVWSAVACPRTGVVGTCDMGKDPKNDKIQVIDYNGTAPALTASQTVNQTQSADECTKAGGILYTPVP